MHTKHKKIALWFIAAVMVFSFGAGIATSTTTSAQPVTGTSNFSESVATCAVQSVGWVICPTMRTIAQLADYGFAFINRNYLKIDYDFTGGDSGIFIAWGLIRNIANIVLVLAFLYIVYTQITGRNTGEWNLKRILPRLIVGAIFLNLSYYICVGAIQASNALGSATLTMMIDVAQRIGTPALAISGSTNGFEDGVLTNLVTTMLSKSGVVWVLMAPMAAVTISIAVVSAATLILLIARKVVVSMLVLVSPLLFVAYMLPNLEHYFQQWVRLFLQLLLLYPVIAFLLGTGQIVSATIISVGTGGGDANYSVQNDGYQARNGGSGSASTDLAAAGAAVLPILGAWWMMKGLSAIMSNAGTRITAGIGGRRAQQQAEKIQAKMPKPGPTRATNINVLGGNVNVFDRKPAFSRVGSRRRKATAGGSSLTNREGNKKPNMNSEAGKANNGLPNPLNGLDGLLGGKTPEQKQKEQQQKQEAQKAGEIGAVNAQNATAAVQAMTAAGGDNKKSANDAFKSLNQRNKPQSPDAQRSFGTAQPAAGQAGGSSGPSVSSHSNEYRAPQIAQTMSAPVQTTAVSERIVAVPQQIDASSLISQTPPEAARVTGQLSSPVEMQEKAKGIANKYLFDSARDIDEAGRKLDGLTKKHEDEEDKPKDA